MEDHHIQRSALQEVVESVADTPVVLIHGPRQAGKSTLALAAGRKLGAGYVTLDDPAPRGFAERDPAGFLLSHNGPLIIDEVQRAPGLFLALKAAVDRDRKPGRYLLTGSANVLALPKISDSLAGRIAIIDLLPFSQSEIEGNPVNPLDRWIEDGPPLGRELSQDDLGSRLIRGGFPEPFARSSSSRRNAWFTDYLRTILERDVRDLANIEGLTQLPRVLRLLAARAGEAINVVELSRETQIPNTSLHRYLDLLQAVFLTVAVPAWSSDQSARLTKTPRTYLVDTGLLCHLLNLGETALERDPDAFGRALRNFVALELKKLCTTSRHRPTLLHLRTVRRLEVDFVLEDGSGAVTGIHVKAAHTVLDSDLDGLRFLDELAGDRFGIGIVLYLGSEVLPLARNLYAVPVAALWG